MLSWKTLCSAASAAMYGSPLLLAAVASESNCGYAALNYVCAELRKPYPSSGIEQKDDVTIAELCAELNRIGIKATAYHLDPADLAAPNKLYIAHLKSNHFVVVEHVTPEKLLMIDQNRPPVLMNIEDFLPKWSGIAVVINGEAELRMRPSIAFSSSQINLGNVEKNHSADFSISITNVGRQPITLVGVESSCGCVLLEKGQKSPIPPSSEVVVKGRFTGKNDIGFVTQSLVISSSDTLFPIARIPITANIVSFPGVVPTVMNFGVLPNGSRASKSIKLYEPLVGGEGGVTFSLDPEFKSLEAAIRVTVEVEKQIGRCNFEFLRKDQRLSVPLNKDTTIAGTISVKMWDATNGEVIRHIRVFATLRDQAREDTDSLDFSNAVDMAERTQYTE